MVRIANGRSNMANASARAKARKASLIDSTRMRQLLQKGPDSIGTSIAEFGYRNELDIYAGKLSGADLIEAALNHNLDNISTQCYDFAKEDSKRWLLFMSSVFRIKMQKPFFEQSIVGLVLNWFLVRYYLKKIRTIRIGLT